MYREPVHPQRPDGHRSSGSVQSKRGLSAWVTMAWACPRRRSCLVLRPYTRSLHYGA